MRLSVVVIGNSYAVKSEVEAYRMLFVSKIVQILGARKN